MKRKMIYFLFILCSFLLLSGKVFAEGEEVTTVTATNEKKISNYKTYCKKYSDMNDKLLCCSGAGEATDIEECKASMLNACVKLDSLQRRYECCEKIKDKTDKETCNRLSNQYCSSTDSVELTRQASNVKIVYEPFDYKPDGFDDPDSENYSVVYYMMDIKIYNLNSNMYISVNNGNTEYEVNNSKMNSDGVVVLRDSDTTEVKKYTFTIYADSPNCKRKILRTIRLTVPKYNYYSTRAACEDIPEYYLCHQYINFDVDAENFLKNTNNYRAKLEKSSNSSKSDDKSNKSSINKALSTVSDNKIYIIGGILLIGVVITVLILRRRDN